MEQKNFAYHLELFLDGKSTTQLIERFPFVVGRISSCDLQVEYQGVSRRQFEIDIQDGALVIKDLGSTNGTHLRGGQLPVNTAVPLKPGERIDVGQEGKVFFQLKLTDDTLEVSEPSFTDEVPPLPELVKFEDPNPSVQFDPSEQSLKIEKPSLPSLPSDSRSERAAVVKGAPPANSNQYSQNVHPIRPQAAQPSAVSSNGFFGSLVQFFVDLGLSLHYYAQASESRVHKAKLKAEKIEAEAYRQGREKVLQAKKAAKSMKDKAQAKESKLEQQAQQQAQQLLAEIQQQIDEKQRSAQEMHERAQQEAGEIIDRAKADVRRMAKDLKQQAQDEANQKLKSAKQQIDQKLRDAKHKIDTELGASKKQAAKLESDGKSFYQKIVTDGENKRAQFQAEVNVMQTQISDLRRTQSELAVQAEKAKDDTSKLVGAKTRANEKFKQAQNDMLSAQTELESFRSECERVRHKQTDALEQVRDELEGIKQTLADAHYELQQVDSDTRKTSGQHQQLSDELEEQQAELQQLQSELKQGRSTLRTLIDQQGSAQESIELLAQTKQQELERLEQKKVEANNEIAKLKSAVEQELSEQEKLASQEAEEMIAEVKARLQEHEDKKRSELADLKAVATQAKIDAQNELTEAQRQGMRLTEAAEQQAKQIVQDAMQNSESTKAKVQDQAKQMAAESGAQLSEANTQAQQILAEAEKRAELIAAAREKETEQIKKERKLEAAQFAEVKQSELQVQSQALAEQKQQGVAAIERELTEVKVRKMKSVEADIAEFEKREMELLKSRTQNVAHEISALIGGKLKRHLGQGVDEETLMTVESEIKRAADKVLLGVDFEDSDIGELIGVSPMEAKQRGQRFWRKVVRTSLACVVVVVAGTWAYRSFNENRDRVMEMASSGQTASEIFVEAVQEKRKEESSFNPKQDSVYKKTYTDRVLYMQDYVANELNGKYREKWTVDLLDFIFDELSLPEGPLTVIMSQESILVTELKSLRAKINGRFTEEGIQAMRKREKKYLKRLGKELRTKKNLKRFLKFKKDHFSKHYSN